MILGIFLIVLYRERPCKDKFKTEANDCSLTDAEAEKKQVSNVIYCNYSQSSSEYVMDGRSVNTTAHIGSSTENSNQTNYNVMGKSSVKEEKRNPLYEAREQETDAYVYQETQLNELYDLSK